ncbi:MAG: FkbM family methyltransferase, partial [Nitrososphaerales archaeon]
MSILKRLHSKPMLIKARDGLFWCADYATDFEVVSDLHEPWFLAIFKPKIGDVVLDLGAHIGRYSVVAGKLVGESGKVIAIEANPDNFQILRLNIRVNDLQNVVSAINAAAWKEVTTLTLFRDTFSGRHSVYKTTDNHSKIDTVTVDELVRQYNLPEIDWMKVDIEGAEYAMLLGAKATIISEKIKFMLLEVHTYEILNVITQLLSPLYDINIIKRTQD